MREYSRDRRLTKALRRHPTRCLKDPNDRALPTLVHFVRRSWHYSGVEDWEIKGVVAVSPTDPNVSDAAYLLKVAYGDEQAEVVVEFASPSSVASGGYAEEVVRKFLGHDELPQRIVVDCDGSVRVATSPLVTERVPRGTSGARAPQRARRRRRG
jgi:hypothetical protein